MTTRLFLAYLTTIIKNMIFGASIFFTSTLTETVDVLDVLALRFLLSAVVMWFLKITKVFKISVSIRDVFKKEGRSGPLRIMLLTAFFEPVLYMLFETLGISMSTGITTGVILSLAPISTCICEELILKERSTFLQKIFLGIGIVGVVHIAINTNTSDGNDSLAGILCLIFAVVTNSLYVVFTRKVSTTFSTVDRTYVYVLLGAIAFNIINIIRHLFKGDILNYFNPYFKPDNMMGFIYLSIICSIIGMALANFALSKAQASTLSAFGGVSTLTTIAAGVIFGGERLEIFHIIGLILIVTRMIGVGWIAIKRDKLKTVAIQSKNT